MFIDIRLFQKVISGLTIGVCGAVPWRRYSRRQEHPVSRRLHNSRLGGRGNDTVEARLQRMLQSSGTKAEVLNAGVGNYNAERYISCFFKERSP